MCDLVEIIKDKLLEIEKKENVNILYAVESGSRAWGFASPDSDYDVRFIYIRKKEDYLRLEEIRDVIEWQLDEVLDINGWDLKKALIQFHKGNATLFEWSNSPIVYKTTEQWEQVYNVARKYFSLKSAGYHYYGTAVSTHNQYLKEDLIMYKKYFYALRPLLACCFLQERKCIPPVLFDKLLEIEVPNDLRHAINELLDSKKKTDERELNKQIPIIRNFIVDEIARQKRYLDDMGDDRNPDWEALNSCFLNVLNDC